MTLKLTNKVKITLQEDDSYRKLPILMSDLHESGNLGYLVEGSKPYQGTKDVILLNELIYFEISGNKIICTYSLSFWNFKDSEIEILEEIYNG